MRTVVRRTYGSGSVYSTALIHTYPVDYGLFFGIRTRLYPSKRGRLQPPKLACTDGASDHLSHAGGHLGAAGASRRNGAGAKHKVLSRSVSLRMEDALVPDVLLCARLSWFVCFPEQRY